MLFLCFLRTNFCSLFFWLLFCNSPEKLFPLIKFIFCFKNMRWYLNMWDLGKKSWSSSRFYLHFFFSLFILRIFLAYFYWVSNHSIEVMTHTVVSVNWTTRDSKNLGKKAVEICFEPFQALQKYDVKKKFCFFFPFNMIVYLFKCIVVYLYAGYNWELFFLTIISFLFSFRKKKSTQWKRLVTSLSDFFSFLLQM